MTRLSDPVKGIVAMIAGMAFLIVSDALSKHLVESHPIGQVLCLRQVAALLFILPYVRFTTGLGALKPVNLRLQLLRGLVFIVSGYTIVWALQLLPLATVTAITFSGPIFVALLSGPLLGERVARGLWIAILAGFVAVLLMVRPGATSFEWALLLPVASAFLAGLRDMLARILARTDTTVATLFWSSIVLLAGSALSAVSGWTPVGPASALWFLLSGVVNFAAHLLLIEAYRLGRAAMIAPFKYSSLLWSVLIGWFVWDDLPDAWIWLGAAILVASGIWIARVEGRRA